MISVQIPRLIKVWCFPWVLLVISKLFTVENSFMKENVNIRLFFVSLVALGWDPSKTQTYSIRLKR